MNFESYFGSYEEDDRRYSVWAELRVEPVQSAIKQTINHEPIPEGAVEIALTGTVYDTTDETGAGRVSAMSRAESRFVSGGQIETDNLRKIGRGRLADLWDEWHLNGMTAGCAHQGETWTCTNDQVKAVAERIGSDASEPCGTLNGWPEVRRLFGEHPYPKRGDECVKCERNRWDEPTDWCPVSGYHYGSAWLYRVPPPEIVAELRKMFGQKEVADVRA